MTVLPVVAREMSVLARRKSMYWSRWVTAVVALFVMLWLLVVSASQVSFAQLGASIFFILSSLCFAFAILIGMHATADCLSEEKREGTLGLLFLTDLRSFDVIGGKLAASSLQAALALIGVIPMISLALLLGGVTLRQFGEVSLVLGNTMFLSLAVGVFVSSLSRNERKAMVGTFVALFVITLGPWIIAYLLQDYLGGVPERLVAASPLFDFAMIHSGPTMFRPAGPNYFWHSLAGLHLFAWALLSISAWILPRAVNELPARRFLRIREFADNFVYGRLADRKRYRAELLDRNAFLWLASRERVKPRYAWGVLAFFAALYLWIALQFKDMLFDLAICGAVMFLTHLVFKIWAASEVCNRLIQDRRSGALELLLSTPLSVRQIAEGQSLALRRLFLKPIVVLILVEIFLLYNGLNAPLHASAGTRVLLYIVVITTFLVDLWALKWVGLWLSLTGKSMERVLLATIGRVLILPWLAYATAAGFFGAKIVLLQSGMDTQSAVFGWGLLSILISVTLGYGARENFLSQFRELATRRFDSVPEPEPTPKTAPKKTTQTTPIQAKPLRRFRSAVFDVFKRRPVVASLVLLLLVAIVGIVLRSEYWSYRLKREIADVASAGFPATQSEAVRYNPAPASAENGFAMLESSGIPSWGVGLPMQRVNRGATPEEANRAKLAQAAALLITSQSQLRALWRLPEFKRAYLDPLAADFWQMQGSHMSYSALAEADIIVALDQGGPTGVPVDRIERSLRALLAHARLLRSQPVEVAQQCASEALRRVASVLEDVLKRDLLDDKTLELLLHDARAVDDPEVVVRTLAVQRALFIEPPPNPWGGGGFVRGPMPVPLQATLIGLVNNLGTRDKAVVKILENYEKAIDIARKPYPRHSEASRLFDQSSMMRIQAIAAPIPPVTLGYIPEVFWTDAAFAAHLHLVQTALALERYQRRYGKVPDKLEAVVPEFLSAVPIDPFTGKPLSVHRSSGALLIYSVGIDQADDTATALARPAHGTDIVFTFR